MNTLQAILHVINSSSQPLGWYGIDTRLGRKGVIIEGNLVQLLRDLEADGYIEHSQKEGHPHGVYIITEAGRTFLGSFNAPSSVGDLNANKG